MKEKRQTGKFGISMTCYITEHEQEIRVQIDRCRRAAEEGLPLKPQEILSMRERHQLMIGRLQHERLIHLIVTSLVALLFALFAVVILITAAEPLAFVILLILGVLLVAYLRHYFLLENAVQRWYLLDDQLSRGCLEPVVSLEIKDAEGRDRET